MDALFIINSKSKEILLFKEFKDTENTLKLQSFLIDLNNILANQKSPFVVLHSTIFIHIQAKDYYENCNDIMYIALLSEDNLIPSVTKILENINLALYQAFGETISCDLIRDNLIQILLMIDQYLFNGVPIFNEINVLSGLINPYAFTDKITEKLIGKAKEYDIRTLMNYTKEAQMTYEGYKYQNDLIGSRSQILFDFIDYMELTYDKNFNLLNHSCYSELSLYSQIASNVDLNILINIPFEVLDLSIDESVSTKKKEILKKKTIDCTVKHGKYKLIQLIPVLYPNSIQLPFKITLASTITNSNHNLSLTIDLVPCKDIIYQIDDLKIKFVFSENHQNSNLTVSIGDFEFDNNTDCKGYKEALWTIEKLDKITSSAVLKGYLFVENANQYMLSSSSCVISMSCRIDKFSISGGCLTKVNISKNPKKLSIFKGAKNVTIIKNLEITF